MQQLVYINSRINNSAIRRIKNDRGDEVIVVPSYTLPDNVVMNGLLYPAQEIEQGYKTLEGTLAPLGHPYNSEGQYISANEGEALDYFYCGVVNKNVQRVKDAKYGHRVYVEKHINTAVAQRTENGRRLLQAIEQGQPIHTSTGVLVTVEPVVGNAEYDGIATGLLFDHDAILLDETGAATPEDGVGLMVNGALFKQVHKGELTLSVNSAQAPQREQRMIDKLRAQIESIFNKLAEHGELDEPTDAESVTTNNQEGDIMRDMIINALKGAGIDIEGKTDDQLFAAYNEHMKGNAADQPAEPKGEQAEPKGDLEVNAEIEALIAKQVQAALQANQAEAEKAERAELVEQITAVNKELTAEDLQGMSVNALRKVAKANKQDKPAFNLAGGFNVNSESSLALDQLPD